MFKLKLLAVIAGMIAALAVSIAPAFAEYGTNEKGEAVTGGLTVFEGGGAKVVCGGVKGARTIMSGGKEAVKGNVLALKITTWNKCVGETMQAIGVAVKIAPCTLSLTQRPTETQAKGWLPDECTIGLEKAFKCTIHIPAGKAAEKVNFGLESNQLENSGLNLQVKAEDTGITWSAAACPGASNTTMGTFKSSILVGGVKEI